MATIGVQWGIDHANPSMETIGFKWGIDRSITGMGGAGEKRLRVVDTKAVAAELIGMFFFVAIGCGAACAHGAGDAATRLVVAFAFGMAILVLAYSIGHHSGGHLNCAVTFSLVLGGAVPWYQGLANLAAQLMGSVLGAILLSGMFPCGADVTTNLGSNIVNDRYNVARVLVGEVFATFLLCFTVWETAVTPQASCGKNACIAIGFAVFLAHIVLLPIDGCSINPTRSFGPAIVSKLRGCHNYTEGGLADLWIMWIGPLLGAALAAAVQNPFVSLPQISIQSSTKGVRWDKELAAAGRTNLQSAVSHSLATKPCCRPSPLVATSASSKVVSSAQKSSCMTFGMCGLAG